MRLAPLRLLAATIAVAACSSSTSPLLLKDPSLNELTARAHWIAFRPSSYSFEFIVQSAWFAAPDFARVTVTDGRVSAVRYVNTGEQLPLERGFTIDALYDQFDAARARGESITDLEFSAQGIPIQAMIGTFANDGGVYYRIRTFSPVED
jgi:hypothetical protein